MTHRMIFPERKERLNTYLGATAMLSVLMVVFYAINIGYIASARTSYTGTTLHVFVILGAVLLPLRFALVPALIMGFLSCVYAMVWGEVNLIRDVPTISQIANYFIPRLLIPVTSQLTYDVLRRHFNSTPLSLTFTAIVGTLTNSIVYLVILQCRMLYGLDEVARVLNSQGTSTWKIFVSHFPLECIFAILVILTVSRYWSDEYYLTPGVQKRASKSFAG